MAKEEMRKATDFRKVTTASGKIALEAYSAVYQMNGLQVAICAPRRQDLLASWVRMFGIPIDERGIQEVWIVRRGEE